MAVGGSITATYVIKLCGSAPQTDVTTAPGGEVMATNCSAMTADTAGIRSCLFIDFLDTKPPFVT
jgi:hypothetical protein